MNKADYVNLDAVGIAESIRRGETTASEVAETAIDIIEGLNPKLNMMVIENFANARKRAKKPLPETPIAGAPFLLKDVNQFSHDMPTTFSCRYFGDAKPKADSELVKRWRDAGLLILGKTNTPEFAEDFVCEPTYRGTTFNPWNPEVTTGGSSGGAGAAVAAGVVPIAHATDLGGSIRIPAACCGVFGLKPTSGLNPVGPYYPEISAGFNSDHVLSRTVRDSAASLDATAGPMAGARYHIVPKVESFLRELDHPVPKLKIGVSVRTPHGDRVGPRQIKAVDITRAALESMGHITQSYTYPTDLGLGPWMETLWMMDVAYEIDQRVQENSREPLDEELEALTKYLRGHVAKLSAMDLYMGRQAAHEASVKLMDSMKDIDLLLTPSISSDPIPVGAMDSRTENFTIEAWGETGHAFAPFSYICNLTGQPAASLPVQLNDGEHPSAIQLAGHHRDDHLLLQVANALESHFEWSKYQPPTWAGHYD